MKENVDNIVAEVAACLERGDDDALADALQRYVDAIPSAESMARLLLCMTDEGDYLHQMYAIVHACERCDWMTYTRAVVASLVAISGQAPRWAETLVARLVKSKRAALYHVLQLEAGLEAKKLILRLSSEMQKTGHVTQTELDSVMVACGTQSH
jgi:hypothetical protein